MPKSPASKTDRVLDPIVSLTANAKAARQVASE